MIDAYEAGLLFRYAEIGYDRAIAARFELFGNNPSCHPSIRGYVDRALCRLAKQHARRMVYYIQSAEQFFSEIGVDYLDRKRSEK
jgi:hypothetical protein